MNDRIKTLSIAAIALLGASGLALAGGASKSSMDQSEKTGMQSGSTAAGSSGKSAMTKDAITLTSDQKKTVYQELGMEATAQEAPSGFQASVGATLPSAITLEQVPNDVSSKVPAVANYRFAKLEDDRLLIVDPNDRRVVSIIEEEDASQQQGNKTQ